MFLSTEAPVSGRRVCQAEPAGEDLARPRGSALVASPVTTETWGAVRAGGCGGRGGSQAVGGPLAAACELEAALPGGPRKTSVFSGHFDKINRDCLDEAHFISDKNPRVSSFRVLSARRSSPGRHMLGLRTGSPAPRSRRHTRRLSFSVSLSSGFPRGGPRGDELFL